MCSAAINKLQSIQNAAFKNNSASKIRPQRKKNTTNEQLHELSEAKLVTARLEELPERYILKAIETNNPIMRECIDEYKSLNLTSKTRKLLLHKWQSIEARTVNGQVTT